MKPGTGGLLQFSKIAGVRSGLVCTRRANGRSWEQSDAGCGFCRKKLCAIACVITGFDVRRFGDALNRLARGIKIVRGNARIQKHRGWLRLRRQLEQDLRLTATGKGPGTPSCADADLSSCVGADS
jgi:hypothetical protein